MWVLNSNNAVILSSTYYINNNNISCLVKYTKRVQIEINIFAAIQGI